MRNFILLLTFTVGLFTESLAQRKDVAGTVTDENGQPVARATVQLKSSTTAVFTGEDGSFSINVPSNATTLVVSSVGFETIEQPITGNMLSISLRKTNTNLNEVVVVGYGQSQKRDITGSISKVNAQLIENRPVQSFESALQGRAAGVVIENTSGKVGQGIKVRIRGTSSISASSQPLYVVDGIPLTTASQSDINNEPTNPLIDLNPNDIESVEVLKDAASSAIYGARGANGVVLITTKKGSRNDQTTIELNTNFGFSNPTKKRGFMNAAQYAAALRQAAVNDGRYGFNFDPDNNEYDSEQEAIDDYVNFYEKEILDFYSLGTDWRNSEVDVNWEDQQYRKNAMNQQYDLSVRGGNAKTRFYISGFYNDQEAIVIVNRFKRYGGRINLDHNINEKLSIGMNASITRSQLERVSNDNAFSTPGQLVAQLPISPLTDPETGDLNANTLYSNGLFDAKYNSDDQVTFRTIGNVFANYQIIPSLAFRSEFGTDILSMTQLSFADARTQDGSGIGEGQYFTSQNVTFNTNNYFTHSPDLGDKLRLTTLLGMSYQQNDATLSSQQAESYPSGAIKNLAGATNVTFGNSTNSRYNFLSYFLRSNLSFNDKYLFGFSIRADGSSRFGPENKYGYFPAFSAGWLLSEENFLRESSFINYLKLRGSWGLTGNAEINELLYLNLFNVSNYPNLPGFIPSQLGDENLKWEKTAQADIGLEFGLFSNRLSGEIDVYQKNTTDLLLAVNVPATNGYFDNINFLNQIYQNVGSLKNRGVELTLNGTIISTPSFKWTSSLNFAFNRNEVTDLNGEIIPGGGRATQRAIEGQPIGVFFMPVFAGVDPATGDALYFDSTGKTTADYNQAARVVAGNPNPDFTGGFNNTFTYKGFDLNVFFTFVSGNDVYNAAGIYTSSGFGGGLDNQTTDLLGAWKQPGDITNIPRLGYSYPTGQRESTRWMYDGSYIRLRQLTLGYNLPSKIAGSLNIKGARLFVSGQNLWLKTDYPSDPEVNTVGTGGTGIPNISAGTDFYTIPQPRTISFGLNVRF